MYSEKLLQVFGNPQNVGVLHGHNAQGTFTNPNNGDMLRIYLLVEDGIVRQAKYKAFGGVYLIALASIACDTFVNQKIDDIARMNMPEFVKIAGELDQDALDTIGLISVTADMAITDYYKRIEKENKNK